MSMVRGRLVRAGSAGLAVLAACVLSAGPAFADESSDNAGPLNVSGTGDTAAGINDSAFFATGSGEVAAGAEIGATANYGAGAESVAVYAIPVTASPNPITGGNNATLWVDTRPGASTPFTLDVTPVRTIQQMPVTQGPQAGASLTVVQDGDGSRRIRATAIVPQFTGMTDAFFLQDASTGGFGNYAFHVFDADTQEWIDPGRTGVLKRLVDVNGTQMLEMVDPLTLPESALGRNIRVGFVTYYYSSSFSTPGTIPARYAGLSAAILMRLAGTSAGASGAWPVAAMQQFAVPAGTQAESCAGLAPANVDEPALQQMRGEGWSVSYAQWPNEGTGGWVCQRQPSLTSLGWVVQ